MNRVHSIVTSACVFLLSGISAWGSVPKAVLVDKKLNQLHIAEYHDGSYEIFKTFHATLGQVKGDKEDQDDLKTPEGIYTFTSLLRPPMLQPKYGVMSLAMNFPNPFDQLAGRTGYGIMLHATNEPDRLKLNYDSEGCIVVKNEEIREIESHVRLGLTPILVFADLTPEYLSPGKDDRLRIFFEKWLNAWTQKSIDDYIENYHSDFSSGGKDKLEWKSYKSGLNSKYQSITIIPDNILYYRHPKYSVITFTQDYRSTLKSGQAGHRSKGTKILYVAEEHGLPKIISETFTKLSW